MPGLGWSGSAAIRRSSFRLASSRRRWRPPPHRGRADELHEAALDSERLQVREGLLQRKPLLVKVLALAPQLDRHLPCGVLAAGDDLRALVEPAVIACHQRRDPAWPNA